MKNDAMTVSLKDLEKAGLTRDPNAPGLSPIAKAFLEVMGQPYTAKTHTELVLGNPQIGYTLKIICDSTGMVIVKDYDLAERRERIPYPRCQFCGAVNKRWEGQVIDVQAELVIDTDTVDAFPALYWYLDELGAVE